MITATSAETRYFDGPQEYVPCVCGDRHYPGLDSDGRVLTQHLCRVQDGVHEELISGTPGQEVYEVKDGIRFEMLWCHCGATAWVNRGAV